MARLAQAACHALTILPDSLWRFTSVNKHDVNNHKEGKIYTARVSYEILKVSMLVSYLTAAVLATYVRSLKERF